MRKNQAEPGKRRPDLRALEQWATPRDLEVIEAIEQAGSHRAAAEVLGMHSRNVDAALKRLRLRAAKYGYSPDHDLVHPVAPGQRLKGVSTLHHPEKGVVLQWVKSREDSQAQEEVLREALEALKGEIPALRPTKAPAPMNADLLNCYIVTDYHIGALAWPEETGDDWNTQIAEQTLLDWFGKAIEMAPAADTAVLAQIGDFLHFDGLDAVTPTSGHVLDADTRFPKLVRVAINTTRRIVSMLLERHQTVHVLMAEGNHDLASSVWLRELFASLYCDEPRVIVDTSPDPYYCIEHGKTSLFFHHGHKRKPENVDHVFAAKFREVFGRTEYSYGHLGHMHHKKALETTLMEIEQHPTLAGADSHASRGGWLSKRRSSAITYSKRFGEVVRVTIPPEMLEAAA